MGQVLRVVPVTTCIGTGDLILANALCVFSLKRDESDVATGVNYGIVSPK